MNKWITDENNSEIFFQKVLEITSILSVVFFITFSILKRFVQNEGVLWIPLILFAANFLILIELFYLVKIKKHDISRKNYRMLIGQGILNFAFVFFIGLIIFDIL